MGKRKALLVGLIVLVVGFLYSIAMVPSVPAESKILKVSHQWPKGDIRDQWANRWVKLVTDKTNGSVKFRIYPAAALFKPKAQHDALKNGALDVSVLPFIYLSGKIPAYAITSMPCLVKNAAQGTRWGSSEIGSRLDAIGIRNGFRTVSWGCIMGSVGSKKRPVILPTDLKGFQVRGAGWAMEEVLKAGGASISSMPSTEVYFALQTGALDALTTTYSSFLSFRLFEVLDHLTISKGYGIFYAHHGILVSNATWERLSNEEKLAFIEAGREAEPFMLQKANSILEQCRTTFETKGVQIHDLSGESFSKWFDLAKETAFKTYAARVERGDELLKLALEVK